MRVSVNIYVRSYARAFVFFVFYSSRCRSSATIIASPNMYMCKMLSAHAVECIENVLCCVRWLMVFVLFLISIFDWPTINGIFAPNVRLSSRLLYSLEKVILCSSRESDEGKL